MEVYNDTMTSRLEPSEEVFAQALAMGFTSIAAAEHAQVDLTPVESQMLSHREDIRKRVSEIVRLDEFDSSLEHLRIARQLEIDRDFAYQVGNPAAAINATVQRAKLLGIFVERSEHSNYVAVRSGAELTPDEWEKKFAPGKENPDE